MSKEKTVVILDSQKLSAMSACQRMFSLRFINHWVPRTNNHFIERGSLMHAMLQVYYNCKRYRTRWSANGKTHADVVQACVTAGRRIAHKWNNVSPQDLELTIKVFRNYCTYQDGRDWTDIRGVEIISSRVLHEDDDLMIVYESKNDLIVGLPNGKLMPVDHKTVSKRKPPKELSNQFLGYCWMLDVKTVTINDIGYQQTLKPEETFMRHVLTFNSDAISEWREQTVWWVKHTLDNASSGYFPPNFTACHRDTNMICSYLEVCKTQRGVRELKLKSLYDIRPWDPGNIL